MQLQNVHEMQRFVPQFQLYIWLVNTYNNLHFHLYMESWIVYSHWCERSTGSHMDTMTTNTWALSYYEPYIKYILVDNTNEDPTSKTIVVNNTWHIYNTAWNQVDNFEKPENCNWNHFSTYLNSKTWCNLSWKTWTLGICLKTCTNVTVSRPACLGL